MDESEETNSRMSRNQGQTRSQNVDSQGPIMGFCHQCDRQVLIDRVNFVCSVCGGGFIELFEINDQNATNRQATTPSSESNLNRPMISQIRIEGANENLLPLLFPGLLNPLQNAFQSNNSFQQHQSPNPVSFFSSLLGSNLPNQQQQQQQNLPRQGESPRVQLIVPGEQFDLYGVINSVFNELIDPQNRTQPNQFQFQLPNIRMIHMHGDIRDYAWGANGLDTIITQLLNQLENSGPPPASQDQLKNLPEVVINQNDVNNSVQCAICMEDFNLNDKAKKLPCKHLFHEPCIVEWLKLVSLYFILLI
jgi:E3 ubiquitin-protein ligase RNF115/126